MKELKVKKTITLNADISKVWNALTNPEMTKQYMFGCKVVSDWKVGSPIIWKGNLEGKEKVFVKGSIEKIEPGKLLQYTTFDPNAEYNDVPSNYVQATYELTPKLGKTVLSVTQGNYANVENGQKRYYDSDGGWNRALTALKALIENKP